MVTIGIICEYNPFHNGHLYQIESARKRFGAGCAVVAIMSGNFVQRGEAAVLDKWSRTRAAILCGVNLVIELPAVYATGSAERFADGGVALAASLGLCDYLVFGSESGDLALLDPIAEVLSSEPGPYRRLLRDRLDEGLSYPASRARALGEYAPGLEAESILKTPNNILAIEYLKALKRRRVTRPKPFTVKREGQGYLETGWEEDSFHSASAIRACAASALAASTEAGPSTAFLLQNLADAMPAASLAILADRFHRRECIVSREAFKDTLFSLLRSLPPERITDIPGMNEGLGERLKEQVRKSRDFTSALSGLIDETATRRHPKTRVQRALLHLMMGLETADLELFDKEKGPFYLRVLGFDKKGQYLLKKMKTSATLPILMKGSDFLEFAKNPENRALRRMAELDCVATDLWMLRTGRSPGQDFIIPPVACPKPAGKAVASAVAAAEASAQILE